MRYIKRSFIAITATFLIAAFLCVIFYAQVTVFIFARSNNLDISYKKLQVNNFTNFVFTDLKATKRDKGVGIF